MANDKDILQDDDTGSPDPRLKALAERVNSLIAEDGSVAKAAKRIGMAENSLRRLANAKNQPGVFALVQFAQKTGADLLWLLGQEPASTTSGGREISRARKTVTVTEFDAKASAGKGALNENIEVVSEFEFPAPFLKKLELESWSKLHAIRVKGDSLEPTIGEGALLLIDGSERWMKPPAVRSPSLRRSEGAPIYVFHQKGLGWRVKRIERLGDNIAALISDNISDHPIEIVSLPDLNAWAGKVVWWDNRL